MRMKKMVKIVYIIIFFLLIWVGWSVLKYEVKEEKLTPQFKLEQAGLSPNSPPCLKTYFLIEKYSKQYKVPKYIAYSVAFKETQYKGPFDWDYDPFVSSGAGAHGAMQIMLSTANYINDTTTKRSVLKNNLEYNISTSMKLLRALYKQYHNWGIACGCYNTGSPIMNEYAKFCINNKDYMKNWVNYDK